MPERRRALRAALWALAAAHVAEALVVRRRARSIEPLRGETGEGTAPAGVTVVAPAGAAVDPATRAAAAHDLAAGGVLALDLVPGDLPAERAFRLLRRVAPSRLAVDPLSSPGGAHEAVVLAGSLAGRMAPVEPVPAGRGAMARLTRRAQRHAPAATALRLAPGLRAAPQGPGDRWARARGADRLRQAPVRARSAAAGPAGRAPGRAGGRPRPRSGGRDRGAGDLERAAGPGLRPPPASRIGAARAARCGRGERGPGAEGGRGRGEHRPGGGAAGSPGGAGGPSRPRRRSRRGSRPRRDTCPWCGSGGLAGRLDTVDLFQFKPGRFHLDECRACGHIFQNPALSPAGLAYYYAEFYDGAAEGLTEASFAAMGRIYRRRAEVVSRHCRPRACLDVGTGHGHFCLVARRLWPGAVVDGLDLGDSVDEAARRGWIDTPTGARSPTWPMACPGPTTW